MIRSRRSPQVLVALAACALVFGACAGEDAVTTTSEAATTTAPEVTTTMATTTTSQAVTTTTAAPEGGHVVYLLMEELDDSGGPFLVPVYREGDAPDPEALIDSLLTGVTEAESNATPALSTAIPADVEVLGLDVLGPLATVDLSEEFEEGGGAFGVAARLAQVVFTVTRATGIEEVAFMIEGRPVSVFSSEGLVLDGPQARSDYYDLLPPIFVDSPAWGEAVSSPLEVTGLSNVFEAVSQVMLTDDDGLSLSERTVMATCGTGCWGTWAAVLDYEADRDQVGALIVWEYSAKDGSRVNVREYPVQIR